MSKISNVFMMFSASALLVAASVTSSDARHQTQRVPSDQQEPTYYHWESTSPRDWDSSCFRSSGLPQMYACSSHGG